MRVTFNEFKSAIALFEAELIDTMNSSIQKFIVGAALAANGNKIDEMLAPFVEQNGEIDVDKVRYIIDAGMRQSGGKIEIPINFGMLSSIGVNPITTTITKFDVDKFFRDTIPSVKMAAKTAQSQQ